MAYALAPRIALVSSLKRDIKGRRIAALRPIAPPEMAHEHEEGRLTTRKRAAVGVQVESAREVRTEVGECVYGLCQQRPKGEWVHGWRAVQPLAKGVHDLGAAKRGGDY